MISLNKSLTLFLVAILSVSCLILIQSVSAQTAYTPIVTAFSLQYNTEDNTIAATIKNPSGVNAYNFRWKEHDEQRWYYSPFDDSNPPFFEGDAYGVPSQASNSGYTVLTLTFIPNTHVGQLIDVQIQALYGSYRAVPYGHMMVLPGGPTYDFYFDGKVSGWSSTQTVSYGQASPSPTPQITAQPTSIDTAASTTPSAPEFPAIAFLPLFVVIPLLAVVLMRRYASKSAMQTIKKR